MNEKCTKTHVDLLHMWWGGLHEVRGHPGSTRHAITRQCLTVMTAILRQGRRRKHVSGGDAVLADSARVVVQSHVLKERRNRLEQIDDTLILYSIIRRRFLTYV